MERARVKKKVEVISLVPSNVCVTKNIAIPSVNPQEIKEIISLQASRYSPYSREEIIIDYLDIGRHHERYTKILLVLANRNAIKRQFSILNRAGLEIHRVVFKPEALGSLANKTLHLEQEKEPVIILNLDKTTSDFTVLLDGKVIFSRNISLGTQNLTEEKDEFFSKIRIEVEKSLDSYRAEEIDRIPKRLFFTGAIENARDLEENLKNLPLSIVSFPYYQDLAISPDSLKTLKENRMFSFGDVLAPFFVPDRLTINLIPEEVKTRKAFQERSRNLIQCGISIITILMLIGGILINRIYRQENYLKTLTEDYREISEKTRSIEELFSRIQLVQRYLSQQGYCLEVMADLYRLIPPAEMYLSEITFDQKLGTFVIRGTATSTTSVFNLIEEMEKSKYFKEVKTGGTKRVEEEGKSFVNFDITSLLERGT